MKALDVAKLHRRRRAPYIAAVSFDVEHYYNRGYFTRAEYREYQDGIKNKIHMLTLYLKRWSDYDYSIFVDDLYNKLVYDYEWRVEETQEEHSEYLSLYIDYINGDINRNMYINGYASPTTQTFINGLEYYLKLFNNWINEYEDRPPEPEPDDGGGGGGGGGNYDPEPEE